MSNLRDPLLVRRLHLSEHPSVADAERRARIELVTATLEHLASVSAQGNLSDELTDGLRRHLGRELDAVIVNSVLPQRFTSAELQEISQLNGQERVTVKDSRSDSAKRRAEEAGNDAVVRSAALAARAVHDRARFQHNQVARLRRRHFEVLGVPFVFTAALDLPAVRRIAEHLGRSV